MKAIKVNSKLKFIIASLAIALSTSSWQSINAQSFTDGVLEIGWKSRLARMGLNKAENIGKTYNFHCQSASEDFFHEPIWGTNVYTMNSGICSTAVHAGEISKSGGIVSIEILEGQEFYTGSSKNEIESEDHVGTNFSFTFISEAVAVDNPESQPDDKEDTPSTMKKVMVNSVQRGLERSIEKALSDIFK